MVAPSLDCGDRQLLKPALTASYTFASESVLFKSIVLSSVIRTDRVVEVTCRRTLPCRLARCSFMRKRVSRCHVGHALSHQPSSFVHITQRVRMCCFCACFMYFPCSIFSSRNVWMRKRKYFVPPKTYKVKGKSCFFNLGSLLCVDGPRLSVDYSRGLVSTHQAGTRGDLLLRASDPAWGCGRGCWPSPRGPRPPSWPRQPRPLSGGHPGTVCRSWRSGHSLLCGVYPVPLLGAPGPQVTRNLLLPGLSPCPPGGILPPDAGATVPPGPGHSPHLQGLSCPVSRPALVLAPP